MFIQQTFNFLSSNLLKNSINVSFYLYFYCCTPLKWQDVVYAMHRTRYIDSSGFWSAFPSESLGVTRSPWFWLRHQIPQHRALFTWPNFYTSTIVSYKQSETTTTQIINYALAAPKKNSPMSYIHHETA